MSWSGGLARDLLRRSRRSGAPTARPTTTGQRRRSGPHRPRRRRPRLWTLQQVLAAAQDGKLANSDATDKIETVTFETPAPGSAVLEL